eukprot:TRINITY_DN4149_c0_g2_i1.p1 TRINITY_DN4149_c0_g2~~TRINITY_DN4149_c0_g2_i1.p1  ORF type:complete len:600 (-),score=80.63 TRINITY_DN4149_c0_g2_i1:567-2366(-)
MAIPNATGQPRGIALTDTGAKLLSKILRPRVCAFVEKKASMTTFGALPRRGADFAVHCRTMMLQMAKERGTSIACLFVDIVSAFDSVRLNDLRDALPSEEDGHFEIVKATIRTPWVATQGHPQPFLKGRGLKQGDPLSDICFVAVLVPILSRIRQTHEVKAISINFKQGDSILLPMEDDETYTLQKITVLDISYIDDICFIIHNEVARELIEDLRCLATSVHVEMSNAGFEVNYGQGKTEVTLLLTGAGSRQLRKELQDRPVLELETGNELRIVTTYKHLGTAHAMNSEQARMVADAVHKLSRATMTFSKVFNSTGLRLKSKSKAVHICIAHALYAAHTWGTPPPGLLRKLQHKYHQLVRRATGWKWRGEDAARITDDNVMQLYGYPTLNTLMRARRLQYLARIICDAPIVIPALVQQTAHLEGSWARQMVQDLRWAQRWSSILPALPDPRTSTAEWEQYIAENRQTWSKAVSTLMEDVRRGEVPDSEDMNHTACMPRTLESTSAWSVAASSTRCRALTCMGRKRTEGLHAYVRLQDSAQGHLTRAPHADRPSAIDNDYYNIYETTCDGMDQVHASGNTRSGEDDHYLKTASWSERPKR